MEAPLLECKLHVDKTSFSALFTYLSLVPRKERSNKFTEEGRKEGGREGGRVEKNYPQNNPACEN